MPSDGQHSPAIAAIKGVFLWRSIRTVILLRKNQRQSADPDYSALLSRVRTGDSGNARYHKTAYDFNTLQQRLIQTFNPTLCLKFADALIIVGVKTVRDALNNRLLRHHAASLRADIHIYHAIDKVNRQLLAPEQRADSWNLPSTKTHDALGRLPLFPGMRVMVQENIVFANNVVNGAVGTVSDIKYDDNLGFRTISVVYVAIPGAGRLLGQSLNDIIPIFPTTTYFPYTPVSPPTSTTRDPVNIARTQVPLLPAYVYTDYKAQGRSLDNAIIDLDSCKSIQGAYVMLSRVRTLNGVAVLRPFRPSKIETNISAELRTEFDRLQHLHDHTMSLPMVLAPYSP
ncbi:hypothetical protein L227DRAFT_615905 [Lentinus tigrinus ALCF2SS1-6]|uniref:Uncharacterized protein n=1 Tax=Lentinus tigrinus ALCF2SS1-6 TaxID=1328759 RepID=A0A5C2RST0_9APHY|nr:hypothetical protein L227DRAFT_615905 [Lentinus tigrinus ALCF2SS1-6]